MGDVGWVPCTCSDWTSDPRLESIVRCFLQHFPESVADRCVSHDRPDLKPEDIDVCRCLHSFTNHVFRIRIKGCQGLGFIVKMAAPKEITGNILLPLERGRLEYEAITFFNNVVPGCCPYPLFYDQANRILCTEELHGYQPLSGVVLGGLFRDSGARALAATLASLHTATHVMTVGDDRLRDLTQQFPPREAMMILIKTYHFERPFDPCDPGRRCHPSVLTMLPEVLSDPAVMEATQEAKRSFMSDLECLIHGDLHIESILVNGCDIKFIDAEFARMGSCAFDMGLLLATLILVFHRYRHVRRVGARDHHAVPAAGQSLSGDEELQRTSPSRPPPSLDSLDSNQSSDCWTERHGHSLDPEDDDFKPNDKIFDENVDSLVIKDDKLVLNDKDCRVLKKDDGLILTDDIAGDDDLSGDDSGDDANVLSASDIIVKCSILLEEYTARMVENLCNGDADEGALFQRTFLQKVAAFAGCEILSCVIGPSHMDFMDSSPPAQRDCVRTALQLLRKRSEITRVADFVRLLTDSPL